MTDVASIMNEPQNSDDELLALLQPLTATDDFAFDSNLPINANIPDGGDNADAPLLGPAPPAPTAPMMAPPGPAPIALMMESMNTESSFVPNGALIASPDLVSGQPTGSGNSHPVNGSHESDEDEIAYEPIKTPSRTLRSGFSKTSASKSRSKPKKNSTSFTSFTSRAQPREESKSVEPEPWPEPAPQSPPRSTSPKPPKWDFEVVFDPVPSDTAQEYQLIPPGDEVYRVLEKIPTGIPGETWLSVEFEDGRIDQVSQGLGINSARDKEVKHVFPLFPSFGYYIRFWRGSLVSLRRLLNPVDLQAKDFADFTNPFSRIPTSAFCIPNLAPSSSVLHIPQLFSLSTHTPLLFISHFLQYLSHQIHLHWAAKA